MKPLPETPLVSIVTPSYSTGRFIEETPGSVDEQDYPRVEHIVPDDTPDILARFPSAAGQARSGRTHRNGQPRLFDRAGRDRGVTQRRRLVPAGCDRQGGGGAKRNPDAALVYCNFLHVDEHSVEIERMRSRQASFRQLLEKRNYVPHQTAFIRREALERMGPVDTRFFSALFWSYWRGKVWRAGLLLRKGQFGVFQTKLRDFMVGFVHR